LNIDSLITAAETPSPTCVARLLKMAFDGCDLAPLREQIIARLKANPVDAAALIDLCAIEQILGDQASGLRRQAEALSLHRLYRSSWPASPQALRVLAFMAPGDVGTNTPIEFLLQGFDVVLYSLYVVPGRPVPYLLPDHDIAIVTVGESDQARPVMREIERLMPSWQCPVLNRPDRVLRLSREEMYFVLRTVPGLMLPPTVRIDRANFEKLGRGLLPIGRFLGDATFPLIARTIDSHAGRGLVKLDAAQAIGAYLADHGGAEFLVSVYVDFRSPDGLFRKYRIIWIDGRAYPCHMAIADEWNVWYYNANMAASAAKRAEEAHFLSTFDDGFARRHAAALGVMAERFGLEYVGVDCAELPDGRLLVFEGDTAMVVHDMDPPDLFPYRSPETQKVFAAFYDMLKRKSIVGRSKQEGA
jgi:hypothetical protein